ncbi:Tim44-like domain-containing protein [Hydrogenophaga sp. PAMC20947]|uniref:Tim44 domain-containing protein n=1 Tax=Hydrogenophaga sp. PAMC20947 TaxID=2565558 RepID=UPI00109DC38D|nr:Tim44-like domain-containing protein [Hydrogenophaga sp. PAMC20947]QCB47623.1 Tim44 domain-containing protein [Hydrogenophaga sp. PAMC20947]
MKFLTMLAIVLGLGLSSAAMDAEAKRFGGGRSLGMQRQAAPPKAPANATPAAPAAAGAAAAAPKRSWMGPLAGLAAGLGLAALASHLGFGEGFGSILLIGLAVMAGLAIFKMVMRKRAEANAGAGGAGFQGMRYAHETPGTSPGGSAFERMPTAGNTGSMIGSNLGGGASADSRSIPADFDVAAFERNAKVNFIRLQAAHDAGDLEDIRQFTAPEMFAEIRMDLNDRQGAVNKTDVIELQAAVTEVVEEADRYIVSVRFTGSVREDDAPAPEAVDEIWHMTKAVNGSGGWVVSGIQQQA